MKPRDVQDQIGFGCLVIGLIVGAGGALLGVAINSKSNDFEARIATLESQAAKNAEDTKSAYRLASNATENSIKAHQRINKVNRIIGEEDYQ